MGNSLSDSEDLLIPFLVNLTPNSPTSGLPVIRDMSIGPRTESPWFSADVRNHVLAVDIEKEQPVLSRSSSNGNRTQARSMTHNFGSFVFTPTVKALQERYGSRRQYSRIEGTDSSPTRLGPQESEFIGERDSFYMATLGSNGWPYVQHRGGPKGFLKVIDPITIAFADFRGNKQYISTGNLMTDDRVALILVDYPRQLRLKILGRVEIFEGEHSRGWIEKVRDPDYQAFTERVYVIRIEAFDWNCQQHIVPRYSEQEIREAVGPAENRMRELENENQRLREEISRLSKTNGIS
jgi:hypothetical protein